MRVKMFPYAGDLKDTDVSGIFTIAREYSKRLSNYDIELVPLDASNFDLIAIHAGIARQVASNVPIVSHCHGLHWTADKRGSPKWEHGTNKHVINNIRHAKTVTVPSPWVARVFQRDMRFTPEIVPHGVDSDYWTPSDDKGDYVLAYGKNRAFMDVCDPTFLIELADRFPKTKFYTTYKPRGASSNVVETGILSYEDMRKVVRRARAVFSPIQETFGILTLEAMACGVPVLGVDSGGNVDIIKHGENGWLYQADDYGDIGDGLDYCLRNAVRLGEAARQTALKYTWDNAVEKVAEVYYNATKEEEASVSVIIPVYNKTEEQVTRAIDSVLSQTHKLFEVIVVDDGSTNGIADVLTNKYAESNSVKVHTKNNGGVASARNYGANLAVGKYVAFLDSDDWYDNDFLIECVDALEKNTDLHLAYTGLMSHFKDGKSKPSQWPADWDFDAQLKRRNQVPTANVMRKETFLRMGGYRSRYCPRGAGSEDAELWLRMGAYGYKAEQVTDKHLFHYSLNQGVTSQSGYNEIDWLSMHPWTKDEFHPFASYAIPKNGFSHMIRSYDDPVISVIVPVGKGHEELVWNALDSIEAQTFRDWEVIVVWDTKEINHDVVKAFPHSKVIVDGEFSILCSYGAKRKNKASGAGYARNIGVKHARGDFVVFLDADDSLYPNALEEMLNAWRKEQSIIYTDYVGNVITDTPEELIEQVGKSPNRKVLYRDGNTLIIRHNASLTFECERALLQPEIGKTPYIWSLITCLIPRAWHDEVGGFDENMKSFEDVDYLWRLARKGKCFARVPKELVVYRYATGYRRHVGLQNARDLLEYLREKYDNNPEKIMGCGCKGKKVVDGSSQLPHNMVSTSVEKVIFSTLSGQSVEVSDQDVVQVEYVGGKGAQRIIGNTTRLLYGRRSGGEVFFAHKADVYYDSPNGKKLLDSRFRPLDPYEEVRLRRPRIKRTVSTDAEPEEISESSQALPELSDIGLSQSELDSLRQKGIITVSDLLIAGEEALRELNFDDPRKVLQQALSSM